ncbi:MAG: AAA family ATPase [Magnetococcus sp. DMHC-6]
MYLKQFGLNRFPFVNDADSEIYFQGGQHGNILKFLHQDLCQRSGIRFLLGEKGSGKTSLCRRLAQDLNAHLTVVRLDRAHMSPESIYELFANTLKLDPSATLEEKISAIQKRLSGAYENVLPICIWIDDIHELQDTIFMQIFSLLQGMGQSPFGTRLVLAGLSSFEKRVPQMATWPGMSEISAEILHLAPLTLEETRAYLAFRLEQCGFNDQTFLFSDEALRDIYTGSKGRLSTINLLANEGVKKAFLSKYFQVQGWHIRSALRDLLKRAPAAPILTKQPLSSLRTISKQRVRSTTRPNKGGGLAGFWRPASAMVAASGLAILLGNDLIKLPWDLVHSNSNSSEQKTDVSGLIHDLPVRPTLGNLESMVQGASLPTSLATQPEDQKSNPVLLSESLVADEPKASDVLPVIAKNMEKSSELSEINELNLTLLSKAALEVKPSKEVSSLTIKAMVRPTEPLYIHQVDPILLAENIVQTDPESLLAPFESEVDLNSVKPSEHFQFKRVEITTTSAPQMLTIAEQKIPTATPTPVVHLVEPQVAPKSVSTFLTKAKVNDASKSNLVSASVVKEVARASSVTEENGLLNDRIKVSKQWLNHTDIQKYSIQLMRVRRSGIGDFRAFLAKNDVNLDPKQIFVFPVEEDRLLIYYREFSSRDQAYEYIQSLAPSLKESGPFVLPIGVVRHKIFDTVAQSVAQREEKKKKPDHG